MMKKYAIEVFFNKEFDDYVRRLWEQCDENQVSSFMNRVRGTEPHIALAVYIKADPEALKERFIEFIQQDMKSFPLIFDAAAFFPVTAVTYLQPNVSKELLELMIRTHEFFEEFESQCDVFYTLERWFPHTTVGKNMTLQEGKKTVNFVIDQFVPQVARVERFVLVEIEYVNGEVICRNLVTKTL